MKVAIKVLCLALLVMVVASEGIENGNKKKKKTGKKMGVSCSAFAALKIRVSKGRCKGVAAANCTAVASSQNQLREAYATWWSQGGKCDSVKLAEAAKAVATACAAAYTATIAKVSCQGRGFACGWAISSGEAYALAFARAIAQAAVDAGGESASAFCVADVEAVSGAIAEAAASAESKACVKDVGSQEDFQAAMVEQVTKAIAEALVRATASTCDAEGAAAAASLCEGEAGSTSTEKGKEASTEKGKTSRKGEQLEECVNPGKCCSPDYSIRFCGCPDCGSKFWTRSTKQQGDSFRSWRQLNGKICFCYPKPHIAVV